MHPAPGNTSGTLVNGILHHCNLPNVEFSKDEALSDTEDSDDEFNSYISLASSCEGLNSRLSVASNSIRSGTDWTKARVGYLLQRCILKT